MYYIYVLRSDSYENRYVGSTQNIENRLKEHNNGECKYTSGRRPWKLVYNEEYTTHTEALVRENFLKTGQGRKWLDDKLRSLNSGIV